MLNLQTVSADFIERSFIMISVLKG